MNTRQILQQLVEDSLDEAELIWDEVGSEMRKKMASLTENFSASGDAHPSRIPGYETVFRGKPKVDDFIAVVVDLRGSKNHLNQAISGRITDVTEEQRLLYETSALLPVAAKLIDDNQGLSTEYIGDGVLGLFNVKELGEDDDGHLNAIYSAYDASRDCLDACKTVINPELEKRYKLPPLAIGVGMGRSRAIIMAVGYDGFRQARAVGKCVYHATELSKGSNEVWIDDVVRRSWPKTEGGKLRFRQVRNGRISIPGYVILRESTN